MFARFSQHSRHTLTPPKRTLTGDSSTSIRSQKLPRLKLQRDRAIASRVPLDGGRFARLERVATVGDVEGVGVFRGRKSQKRAEDDRDGGTHLERKDWISMKSKKYWYDNEDDGGRERGVVYVEDCCCRERKSVTTMEPRKKGMNSTVEGRKVNSQRRG